ncbi:MAG: hypothetical protein KJ645_02175, partial [Planctomycetes bacterium]|nr:hypothetical protein [Planctomycetota bacterium]
MHGRISLALIALIFLAGCASIGFPPQTAQETGKIPADKLIEISLAPGSFDVSEVEFHVLKESIPVLISKRAKEEMPEGEIVDAEIEYQDGVVFYEVTCKVRGQEQEVLFTADGKVHRWEIGVDVATVPPAIIKQAKAACSGAKLVKAEQILNGAQDLLEYHFKMTKDGIKYKVI